MPVSLSGLDVLHATPVQHDHQIRGDDTIRGGDSKDLKDRTDRELPAGEAKHPRSARDRWFGDLFTLLSTTEAKLHTPKLS